MVFRESLFNYDCLNIKNSFWPSRSLIVEGFIVAHTSTYLTYILKVELSKKLGSNKFSSFLQHEWVGIRWPTARPWHAFSPFSGRELRLEHSHTHLDWGHTLFYRVHEIRTWSRWRCWSVELRWLVWCMFWSSWWRHAFFFCFDTCSFDTCFVLFTFFTQTLFQGEL